MYLIKRVFRALLLPFCWFSPASFLRVFFHRLRGVKIGQGVEIGYFVIIDNLVPDKVSIGDKVAIGPSVVMLAHDYFYGRKKCFIKDVKIGDNAFIGTKSIILPGVEIGKGAKVGALSLVNKSVPENCIVAGIPIKPLNVKK